MFDQEKKTHFIVAVLQRHSLGIGKLTPRLAVDPATKAITALQELNFGSGTGEASDWLATESFLFFRQIISVLLAAPFVVIFQSAPDLHIVVGGCRSSRKRIATFDVAEPVV